MHDVLELRVREIRPETRESKSFFLERTDGRPLSYQPGQFLTLLLRHQGHEVRRSYSLGSAPETDPYPYFTVKRVTNGEISRWMLDTLKEGDLLYALPPAGRFVLSDEDTGLLVFVAAGSGITPIFSLIKSSLARADGPRLVLLYSSHHPGETIFKKDLDDLAAQYPGRFDVEYFFTTGTQTPRRLNNTLLEKAATAYIQEENPRFFLCGPEDFMRMARIVLLFMGFPADAIRKENFVIIAPSPEIPVGFGVEAEVRILYKGETRSLTVPAGTYLLDAALKAGIDLPYSCRGGRCSTCVARCLEGRVKMTINDVLTEREMEAGDVLTCTGLAETKQIVLKVG